MAISSLGQIFELANSTNPVNLAIVCALVLGLAKLHSSTLETLISEASNKLNVIGKSTIAIIVASLVLLFSSGMESLVFGFALICTSAIAPVGMYYIDKQTD